MGVGLCYGFDVGVWDCLGGGLVYVGKGGVE